MLTNVIPFNIFSSFAPFNFIHKRHINVSSYWRLNSVIIIIIFCVSVLRKNMFSNLFSRKRRFKRKYFNNNYNILLITLLMVSLSLPQVLTLGLWAKFMAMSQNGGGQNNQQQQQRQMYQQPRICIQRVPVPVPFPVEKIVEKPVHIQVPVQVPYPVRIRVPVKVRVKVPQPYPVRVNVPQPVPYPIPIYQPRPDPPSTPPPPMTTTERPWTPPPPPPPINVFVTPPRVIMQRPEPPRGEHLQEPDIDDMHQALNDKDSDQDEQFKEQDEEQENCADDEQSSFGDDYQEMKSKFTGFGFKNKFNQMNKWIPTTPLITQQQLFPQQQQQLMPFGQQQQQMIPFNQQQPSFGGQQQQPFGQQFIQPSICPQQPCVQRPVSPFKAPFQAIHGYDMRGPAKGSFGWPNFLGKNKINC